MTHSFMPTSLVQNVLRGYKMCSRVREDIEVDKLAELMLRPDLNRRRTDQRVMLHIAKGSRYSSFHWHGIIMLPNSFAMNCVVKEQMRCSGVAKRWRCKRGREGGCFTANSACNSTAFRWRSRGSMEGRKVAVGDWTVWHQVPSTPRAN